MFIGDKKLYVNTLKFNNERVDMGITQKQTRARVPLKGCRNDQASHKSFAQVLMQSPTNMQQKLVKQAYIPKIKHDASRKAQPWDFEKNMEEKVDGWLVQSLVGRLNKKAMTYIIQETLILEGLNTIKARHLGDDLILLSEEDLENPHEVLKGMREWLGSILESLVQWSPNATNVLGLMIIWVKCYGVPLHFWRKEFMIKLVAPVANLVELDENKENFSRLEYVRLKIRTS